MLTRHEQMIIARVESACRLHVIRGSTQHQCHWIETRHQRRAHQYKTATDQHAGGNRFLQKQMAPQYAEYRD